MLVYVKMRCLGTILSPLSHPPATKRKVTNCFFGLLIDNQASLLHEEEWRPNKQPTSLSTLRTLLSIGASASSLHVTAIHTSIDSDQCEDVNPTSIAFVATISHISVVARTFGHLSVSRQS